MCPELRFGQVINYGGTPMASAVPQVRNFFKVSFVTVVSTNGPWGSTAIDPTTVSDCRR